jgi:Na+-translocating ferredoxin:NAD+ oxidoreductase RnfD subunit
MGNLLKRILIYGGIALAIFWIVTAPGSASSSVNGTGNWLYGVGHSITTFFSGIAPDGR